MNTDGAKFDAGAYAKQYTTLEPQPVKFLEKRAVLAAISRERGYRTITVKARLADKGFSPVQRRTPGLLIPLHNAKGDVNGHQFRPDEPRVRERNPVKYESPSKSRAIIDVPKRLSLPRKVDQQTPLDPPELPPLIQDLEVPLVVTEGVPKADAAVGIGLCSIALLGVSAWHRLPDWNDFPIKGRLVFLCFDSDAMPKRAVWRQLRDLKDWLETHGARVKIIYLRPGDHGAKTGLDDFIAAAKAAGQSDADVAAALLELATDELRSPAAQIHIAGDDLQAAIIEIMLDKDAKDFIKRRRVADLVYRRFEEDGFFCRTSDQRLFFFNKPERRLYDLDATVFEYLTSALTGLGKTESVYGFTLHHLKTVAARTPPLDVHTYAYFDPASGRLAMSDAATGVWVRECGGKWSCQHNGDNGLLFLTEPDAEAFDPDFKADGRNLPWFLDQFLLAPHEALTLEDQKTILLVNLLHESFPALRRTRPIPAFFGAQGSGKTSGVKLLGCLRVGSRFQVSGLRKDKEDSFIAAVCNRTIVGFDNADSRIPWLEDALAVYATGQRYRLRRLYTTNEEVTYDPRASILITSRDPHFNRSDVAERLLPFYFERPTHYRPEPSIFAEVAKRRNGIWGELFAQLAAIADSLTDNEAPPLACRMADFAAFGWILFALPGKERDWIQLLGRIERAQAGFAAQNDGVIEALRIILRRDGNIGPIATGELYKRCSEVADAEHLGFPRTAQGFGRRLSSMRRMIELELKCRWSEEGGHEGQRWITLTPRSGDHGAIGDDDPKSFTESEDRSDEPA